MRLTKVFQHDTAHDDGVWSTSWIADRDGFASGSVDESVKIWEGSGSDSDKGTLYTARHTYTGHTLGVISVASDATGKYMASSALDSIVRVWNVQTNQDVGVSVSSPTEVWSIAFGPTIDDTPTLAVAGGTRASVTYQSCNPAASQEDAESLALQEKANYQLPQVEGSKKERFVMSVAWSPDYRRLACGAMDGTVVVFDVESRKLLSQLPGHHKPVRSLCFTPDGRMLLTACDDQHINLYDVQQGALVDSFSGHESWVLSVSCHPDGGAFASGSSDSKVKLWDLGTRTCSQTVAEHSDQVWTVGFSPDGRRLVSGADDRRLVVYSVA